jgi:hypothetical protein
MLACCLFALAPVCSLHLERCGCLHPPPFPSPPVPSSPLLSPPPPLVFPTDQVLAGVFTFASSRPAEQYLVLTLLTAGYLVLHLRMTPMQDGRAQGLQSVLLSCLAGVALSGAPFAITLEAATPSPQGSLVVPGAAVARQLQVGAVTHRVLWVRVWVRVP